jgi:pilus assembly protein CpaE
MKAAGVNRVPRLVIIDSDPRTRAYARTALGEKDVRVVGEAEDVSSGMRFIRGLQPDVAVIELPDNATATMEALRKIKDEFPELGIILSRHEPSPQLILSGMRAGAQEFVSRPIDGPELLKAIGNVRRQMVRVATAAPERGRIVSVFSSKGGVGGTCVAVNLAVALSGASEARTVVVDLNMQMGDLGLMLNQPPRFSLTDALVDDRVDESRLRSVVCQHESGVNVLTVATGPEVGEEIQKHHLIDLFGTLANLYDFVVVDMGRVLDDRTAEVLELSNDILLLATLDVPAVRNASRYLGILDRLNIDRDRIRLVLNRVHKKARLNVRDVEAALGMETFWTIPNDYEPVSTGIDHGTPAVIKSRRARVSRNFRQLAAALVEPQVEEHQQVAADAPAASAPETPAETPAEPVANELERKQMRIADPRPHPSASISSANVNVDLPGF